MSRRNEMIWSHSPALKTPKRSLMISSSEVWWGWQTERCTAPMTSLPNYKRSKVCNGLLRQLLQKIWDKEEVSESFARATFVMLYKNKGSTDDPSKYRCIGLLSHAYGSFSDQVSKFKRDKNLHGGNRIWVVETDQNPMEIERPFCLFLSFWYFIQNIGIYSLGRYKVRIFNEKLYCLYDN